MKSKQESCDQDVGMKSVESAEDQQRNMTRVRNEERGSELEADLESKFVMEESSLQKLVC